jgi:dTDP-4-amino-4,6-dideoxygalactose transaminase
MPEYMKISLSAPDLTDAERDAVQAVLKTPQLSMGVYQQQFEDATRTLTGLKHALAVNSGTAGLHLCVRAAGIGRGDYVITTPFSFVSSTNVILFEGAIPVYVDVDPRTGNMNPQQVAEAAHDLMAGGAAAQRWLPRRGGESGGRLKAILAVDVFGQPADYDALRAIADTHHLKLIEDSCEALGAEYKGRPAGSLGDMGVFAYYPNKQITTGEGGMVVTDDAEAARLMAALRNQGRAPGDTWLQHTYLGYNYRMDELSAALGAVQMSRLPELLAKRQKVADWYEQALDGVAGVELPHVVETTTRISWFVYVVRLPRGTDRMAVAHDLELRGVPVRPYFLPIHLQPYMVEQFGYQPGDFPVTEDLGARGLALPFSGQLTQAEVNHVAAALRDALRS